MPVNQASPVTVSITRHLDPGKSAEMVAWVRAGATLAGEVPGFLGAGWVQSGPESREWHMLYRFADHDALAAWESSTQRAWWLGAAQDLGVVEQRVERRTGIEGWFDEPASVESLSAAPVAPPRWKQMVVIFMVFLPLSLVANFVASRTIAGWALVPRVVLVTTVMTPLMTYVFLPWITRRMTWWLHR